MTITSYNDILEEVEKPINERGKVVPTSRGEFRVPRKYHLTEEELKELKAKAGNNFPNPFKKCGIYHNLIQALINLGVDKKHKFVNVKKEIKNIMGTDSWNKFVNKIPRSKIGGKDANGRIIQNALVLQRLSKYHPYGRKLSTLGSCINIYKDKDGLPEIELYTNFDEKNSIPTNELKIGKRGRKVKI